MQQREQQPFLHQDLSSWNMSLQAVDLNSELVCVHDSARPLVSSRDIEKVLKDGWLNEAVVLGVPVKATIKEVTTPDDLLLPERILSMSPGESS
ncbi:hypothetical protein CMV_010146 [Castanea mollissima]|uniref:2-C-methyl-D-erythritol 4-phosphate cytidylyltransferase n=1 Tax=Castanea mollissima TaxID=60419 RepID=A0A8J4VY25_9ROSI|nr:hypothetical protein CMV_010146 [Castanea mollissima]